MNVAQSDRTTGGARWARIVFRGAGSYGIVVMLILLLAPAQVVGEPRVVHPEYYYGFAAVGLAWQIAFVLIGSDPVRYRPLMLAGVCEKFFYVAALLALILTHRAPARMTPVVVLDGLLGCAFVVAFRVTPQTRRSDPSVEYPPAEPLEPQGVEP